LSIDWTTHKKIATKGDFSLFERSDQPTTEWRNLKLVRSGEAPKNNWWLAWNGNRLARSRDAAVLAEHNPEIEAWVIEALRDND
jgi:hypothetical protein